MVFLSIHSFDVSIRLEMKLGLLDFVGDDKYLTEYRRCLFPRD